MCVHEGNRCVCMCTERDGYVCVHESVGERGMGEGVG